MRFTLLKSKLHKATVTAAELHYEGSLGIDRALMDRAGILPFERLLVANFTTGARFETYAIERERGSGTIELNGGAARLAAVGDRLMIAAFAEVEAHEVASHRPKVILLDEQNRVVREA